MKIAEKKSSKIRRRVIIITSIIAAVVLVGYVTVLVLRENGPNTPSTMTKEEQADSSQQSDKKQQYIESNGDKSETDSVGGGQHDSTPHEDAAIGLAAQQQSDGTVVVHAEIGLISDGTCHLDVSNGDSGKTTKLDAPVMYISSGSTCAGFSVPVSSIGYGLWTLKLSVDDGSGTTSSKVITQEVK